MHRRSFLRGSAVAGLALLAPSHTTNEPWERLSAALRRPSGLDRDIVDDLERVTVHLESLESQLAPKALLGPVGGHLDNLARLLADGLPSATHARLCSLAAETAGVAGWLTWDLDKGVEAGAYFQSALQAARDAGDHALGAYLVGSAACQPSYKEQPTARLRQLDGETFGFAKRDATPATRAWLSTLEAEAHVLLGDAVGAMKALDQAERALAADDGQTGRPRLTFFDEAYLIGERGMTLSRLGESREAREALYLALSTLDQDMVKSRPRLLSALACTHVAEGDVDEACRVAADAVVIVQQLQVEPNLGAILELRQQLEPWASSAVVRELDDRLASI